MSLDVELISRWQRVALLSKSLLELAQRGEWDLLLEQEMAYLQSIEAIMKTQTPQGLSQSVQELLARYLQQTLDNEVALKKLLQIRLDELSAMISQSSRQQSLNNTYGRLSGMLLVPEPGNSAQ